MSFLDSFKPVLDDGEMLWSLCWKHKDIHRPNLSLTYTGYYKGRWKCWACGATGKVTDSTLQEILKRYGMGKRKTICKGVDWFHTWLLSRENLFGISFLTFKQVLGFTNECYGFLVPVIDRLGAGWDGKSLLFPMKNAAGQIVGIHKRPEKRNLKGSTLGIFAPRDIVIGNKLFITEGVTDTICSMLMGYPTIGRTSANSCNKIIFDLLKDKKCSKLYIVADNDAIGIDGANKLANELTNDKRDAIVILPPQSYKDIKEVVNDNGLDWTRRYINDRFIRASV